MISARRIRGIEVELLEQELTDAALLKMELSNGEDKAAKKVLKIIDSYNELIRKAKLNKEKNGYIKW
ncbi:hypothetical protein AAXE64_07895 [Priestia megaterium]